MLYGEKTAGLIGDIVKVTIWSTHAVHSSISQKHDLMEKIRNMKSYK